MKSMIATSTLLMVSLVVFQGCSQAPGSSTATNIDGSKYKLMEEPDGAVGILAARESAKDGEPIVLVGRIGGAKNPWIEGRCAFTLLDPSMAVVADGTNSGETEICMDDCCAAERAKCTTLVKFVDEQGQVLPVDSRALLGIQESDMVVIQGTAKKDKEGNFVMLAKGLYVRK